MVDVELIREVLEFLLVDSLPTKIKTTLACIIGGMLRVDVLSFAEIGRGMVGDAQVRSNIQKVFNFFANPNFHASRALRRATRAMVKGRQRVILATDWSKFGDYQVLWTAIVGHGRALPVAIDVISLGASVVSTERKHFDRLIEILDEVREKENRPDLKFIVLADRGYDETRNMLQLRGRIDFVIRVAMGTSFLHGASGEFVPLNRIDRAGSACGDLGVVTFNSKNSIDVRITYWQEAPHPEPWFLATTLECGPAAVAHLYSLRFRIEHFFRDVKDVRAGMRQKKCFHLSEPQRVERFLTAIGLMYIFLSLIGRHAENMEWHKKVQVNNRTHRQLGFLRLGKAIIRISSHLSSITARQLTALVPKMALPAGQTIGLAPMVSRPLDIKVHQVPAALKKRRKNRGRPKETDANRALRGRINAGLQAAGVTKTALARCLNLQPTTVYNTLRGDNAVPEYWLDKAAPLLGTTREGLLEGLDWVPRHVGWRRPRRISNPSNLRAETMVGPGSDKKT